jgi:hypothetical protein
VKLHDEGIATIGGGSHFGALGPQALRRIPELDYVIEGEGEQAFSALLSALKSGASHTEVPRLHYRANGELKANPAGPLIDLAEIPPIWSALGDSIDLSRYEQTILAGSPRRMIYIEAGRGCPYACTFCATAPFWERKYRVKSIRTIIDEMRFLFEQFGYDGFMLVHDLLTVDKDFINDFCDAMMQSRLPVEWMANHRTDINLHGLLPKMKTAGCWAMFFGVESASARLQKEMRKGLKRDGVTSTIKGLSDLGIASTCSFVIGFPDETSQELSATIGLGAELKLIGAGMIQFHRLRTWPPAPLSRKQIAAKFDLDSLRIEYPFLDVPADDIAAIEADQEFFAGYFAPHSQAGSYAQLADAELFFTQAVATAPLTIAVMWRLMGASLLDSFYDVTSLRGCITRADVEADTSSLVPIWQLLRPFLESWVASHPDLLEWQRELIRGVMIYEEQRLKFVNRVAISNDDVAAAGDNWGAFPSAVNIAALFEAMQIDQPLTPAFMQESATILVRDETDEYRAYSTDFANLAQLANHPLLQAAPAS